MIIIQSIGLYFELDKYLVDINGVRSFDTRAHHEMTK